MLGSVFILWANPGLFLFIFDLITSHFKYKLKNHRCCAWVSNPGRKLEGIDGSTELRWPPILGMVVARLEEWLLQTQEDRGSNQGNQQFSLVLLLLLMWCKLSTKLKEDE